VLLALAAQPATILFLRSVTMENMTRS
jgi:hypothetical protein